MRTKHGFLCLLPVVLLSACSPAGGRSRLADRTFAGQNRCNPKDHDRPFIIEWDATDMSSFESHAKRDIVLVRYEGCDLKVLTRCRQDSVPGALGSYGPVSWTSGSLEKVEIADENELYAKLPLGVASLGGRVRGGDSLHMEYYVAGLRNATREGVYRSDLAEFPECKTATHFVYAYNLGAFALGSASDVVISAEGSAYGFGAGGEHKQSSKTEKHGGDLGTCKAETAKEIEGCKVPIRLTLRAIVEGDNPDKAARKAKDDAESLNAAGKIERKLEMSAEARARFDAATAKMRAGDGPGCITELGRHDELDPAHLSTEPGSGLGDVRAQCLMLAGQCDAGKALMRKSLEATKSGGPEQIDRTVDAAVARYCQGAKLTARDKMLRALNDLEAGVRERKTAAFCLDARKAVKELSKEVKPAADAEPCSGAFLFDPRSDHCEPKMAYEWLAANCVAHAGDCPGAWNLIREGVPAAERNLKPNDNGSKVIDLMWHGFSLNVQECKKWWKEQEKK